MTATYEADRYRATRQALMADPLIQEMARQLAASGKPLSEWAHADRGPRHEFMGMALEGYKAMCARDNQEPIGSHLGGPAEAIIALAYPTTPPTLPVACRACPWRLANQGTRHPDGWYTKKNLLRLWVGLRRGEDMTCHPTDPRLEVSDRAQGPPDTGPLRSTRGPWSASARRSSRAAS